MPITRSQVALNAIQWINIKPGPGRERAWLFADPAWRSEQPAVHRQIRSAGFDAVMMEVLDTQTLQAYRRMLEDAGLRPRPATSRSRRPNPGDCRCVRAARNG